MSSAEVRQPGMSAGVQDALKRGDPRGALALAIEAERAAPGDIGLKLQRAMVNRAMGDLPGALAALDEALNLDPYDYVALLSKGAVVEKMSGERAAAAIYRNALKMSGCRRRCARPPTAPPDRRPHPGGAGSPPEGAHRPGQRPPPRMRRAGGSTRASASSRAGSGSMCRSRCCCTIRGCRRSRSTTAPCSPGSASWRPRRTRSAASSKARWRRRRTSSRPISPIRRARR